MYHRRINFDRCHPGYFGKVCMRYHHLKRDQHFCPAINLNKLWILASEQIRQNHAKNPNSPAPVIDVVQGSWEGKLHKAVIKEKFFSPQERENIKGVHGICLLAA
ncbi:large ribosomal subunit protein uL15-like [Leptodactylus fuscus]|uniref:large ribosomal subunit protein uL15-like n=1 Tax=Leptodactylus fuscus TaxID=238119 RepID=UPI003F4F3856